MPPFGEKWFAALRDVEDPIAILRLEWIFLSIAEDERRTAERRKDEIEYGGLFANPDVYAQVKDVERKGRRSTAGFSIEIDTSAYDARFDRAVAGHADVKPRREDVASLVGRKRAEMAEAGGPPLTVRRHLDALSRRRYDAADDGDDLIIEEPDGRKR